VRFGVSLEASITSNPRGVEDEASRLKAKRRQRHALYRSVTRPRRTFRNVSAR